ncbi:MAG: Na+/H+ antiporter subunit E [Thermoanaerobaculales bacterium]|jgi:multicomponent Na+:H+ antiporter subunit E|nr:Na+/H+ antiporter subunit E [Thermoanaerobaculales bacterium]
MKHSVALFTLLMAVWLLNSGHYTPLIIGFGVASCLFVVWLARRMEIVDDEALPIHLLARLPRYLPWLALEVVKSNLDVARRILTPGRPDVSPRLFDAPTTQHTDLGRVLYANSITLTPGTVSIRVHGAAITVHAIAEDVADSLLEGGMDRRVSRLEGEPR